MIEINKGEEIHMYKETTIKEIDETFDTLSILFLIRERIFKNNNILLDFSYENIMNDFDVQVEPNVQPGKLPNIKIHVYHKEVARR